MGIFFRESLNEKFATISEKHQKKRVGYNSLKCENSSKENEFF